MITKSYDVAGMTCGGCAASVKKELTSLDEVTEANVDHQGGRLTVTSASELADAVVLAALEKAGYQATAV
ncbi:heavy-metal-associated domain-containing protein [Aeromicrobium sp. Sec7.5]|uniref:heavy-metal-associated domain-containing protein n=1 Tax=Aeromicrobium sp. Sec7.5 TaxID=3121276 RepID=UPI002FE43367